jgi:hypothetical protein
MARKLLWQKVMAELELEFSNLKITFFSIKNEKKLIFYDRFLKKIKFGV